MESPGTHHLSWHQQVFSFYRSTKRPDQDSGSRELGLVAFKGQGHKEAATMMSGRHQMTSSGDLDEVCDC